MQQCKVTNMNKKVNQLINNFKVHKSKVPKKDLAPLIKIFALQSKRLNMNENSLNASLLTDGWNTKSMRSVPSLRSHTIMLILLSWITH